MTSPFYAMCPLILEDYQSYTITCPIYTQITEFKAFGCKPCLFKDKNKLFHRQIKGSVSDNLVFSC